MGCCNLKQDLNVILIFLFFIQKFNYNINNEKINNSNFIIENEDFNKFNIESLNNLIKKNNLTSRNNHATLSTLNTDSLLINNKNNIKKNNLNKQNLKISNNYYNLTIPSNENLNTFEKFKDVFDEGKIINKNYKHKKILSINNKFNINDITDLKLSNSVRNTNN